MFELPQATMLMSRWIRASSRGIQIWRLYKNFETCWIFNHHHLKKIIITRLVNAHDKGIRGIHDFDSSIHPFLVEFRFQFGFKFQIIRQRWYTSIDSGYLNVNPFVSQFTYFTIFTLLFSWKSLSPSRSPEVTSKTQERKTKTKNS